MASLAIRSFAAPDDVRSFGEGGHADLVNVGPNLVRRAVYEPGWRWSEHVKPIVGTESCQSAHLVYVISGRLTIAMDDGTEGEMKAGDVALIEPGHDAWVSGDEPCVVVDFAGHERYTARYNVVPVADVPDQAAEVGMDPDHFEIRFLREPLALRELRRLLRALRRRVAAARGHRHTVQEEVYFLVSGRAQAKLDDEVIDLEPWTAVRVPPEIAAGVPRHRRRGRRLRDDRRPAGGIDDVEFIPDFWID